MVSIFCKKTNNYNKYISPLDLILYSYFLQNECKYNEKRKNSQKIFIIYFYFCIFAA